MLVCKYNKYNDHNEYIHKNNNFTKKCYFCGGNHICRNCPNEAQIAPRLRKYIEITMENFVANNFCCPYCNCKSLKVLGNHTPSLDIVCEHCHRNFEVKSKCLSIEKLPVDLKLPHGNYNEYKNRQSSGLDIFVIIYKVNRLKKLVEIRELLHAKNEDIISNNNIIVNPRTDSNLSTIVIKNKDLLKKAIFNKKFIFNFSKIVDNFLANNN